MIAKTRLLLWDLSYLLFWALSLVMMLLNIWNWLVWLLTFGILILITNTVFRAPKHKLGKVRAFILLLILIVWVVAGVVAHFFEPDFDNNFYVWPSWLKLVFMAIALTFAGIFISKIHQDFKFTEETEENR